MFECPHLHRGAGIVTIDTPAQKCAKLCNASTVAAPGSAAQAQDVWTKQTEAADIPEVIDRVSLFAGTLSQVLVSMYVHVLLNNHLGTHHVSCTRMLVQALLLSDEVGGGGPFGSPTQLTLLSFWWLP